MFDDQEGELFDDQEASTKEKEDAILLRYFKIRIYRVADGVNNPQKLVPYVKQNLSMKNPLGHLVVDMNIIQAASNNDC